MKKMLAGLLAVIFLLTGNGVIATDPKFEEVTKFSTEIVINRDTSLTITEKLDYFTPISKHGIYRYIPEKYQVGGLLMTNKISEIKVEGQGGNQVPFEVTREKGNVNLKIGDPNNTFVGKRTYVISYKVDRAVTEGSGFDELYWDITGEGWKIPVRYSEVKISSPFARVGEIRCFTGAVGSKESNCQVSWTENKAESTTELPISYGKNFTVAVKLNKGNQLVFPTRLQKLSRLLIDNIPQIVLVVPIIVMLLWWLKKGRDLQFVSANIYDMDPGKPQRLRSVWERDWIPLTYGAIKNLTPGEAGALVDGRVDNQDVVAEIVDLARQKLISIERVKKTGFLEFGHDYVFKKLKDSPENLPDHQEYLVKHIFGEKDEVRLSKLKGKFYNYMLQVKKKIMRSLTEKKLFVANPDSTRRNAYIGAVLLNMVVFLVLAMTDTLTLNSSVITILLGVVLVCLVVASGMWQRTAVGTNLTKQVGGLRECIRLGRWREEVKEKNLFIEEVLPFAVSLGVIKKMAKDMEMLSVKPPEYFGGGSVTGVHGWSDFTSDFNRSASSGLSYNPSSSSRGGSGFSGGGSSGGGGGGGGGGSW